MRTTQYYLTACVQSYLNYVHINLSSLVNFLNIIETMLIEYRNVILIHGIVGRQLYGNIPQTNVTMAICSLSFQFACNGNMLLN